ENASNLDVNLISTDADNSIIAGTDGALFVPVPLPVNLYNSDGAIPEFRTVSGTENWLNFEGTTGSIQLNGNNLRSLNTTGSILDIDFSGNLARINPHGPDLEGLE